MLDRNVIDTEALPPRERFGMWLDVVARTASPLRMRSAHADDFTARAEIIPLGPIQLVNYRYPSLDAVRTAKLARQTDVDYFLLALTTTGTGSSGQAGRQSVIGPSEFTFYDGSRPHQVSHEGAQGGQQHASSVVALIPYGALPLPPDRLAPLLAGRMSGTEGVGALLAQYLMQITGHPEQYHAADADRLGTTALDLIATMLGRHLVAEDAVPREVRRRALLAQVRGYIQRHLGDAALSPQTIADAHHVSVRTLHRLFETEDTTVASYVRDLRLDRCRRDLADPAQAHRAIQAVAARWGFGDKAVFSRAFRAAYGETPQGYRAARREQARIVNDAASVVNSTSTY
ncbi:helix-turn-helix domain-containing protein [Micromonospora sp. 4G55]|uniref:AraC-like ligand-binding domain-containing protein n=1 Tax=Micromonospora sp. 4G55 TaxID=2806102 RepID=UPI001A3C8B80|nr:helix-turn-helix domain-containing protein [Micromonospora sp. 4G55]MBM0259645.1 helix-turn-helix domain-containing protein [Micromonospora sp. 4G55]